MNKVFKKGCIQIEMKRLLVFIYNLYFKYTIYISKYPLGTMENVAALIVHLNTILCTV